MSDDVQIHKFEGKQYALAKDVQPYFIELANARKRIETLEKALSAYQCLCKQKCAHGLPVDMCGWEARAALEGKDAPT
ncbi:MAG: hypothetical protein ACO26U_05145 [Burkholderiaceae bacterium]